MKKQIQLLALLFIVSINAATAQYNKNSSFKKKIDYKTQPELAKTWSDWIPEANYPNLEMRHAKLSAEFITIELRNTGSTAIQGQVNANECADGGLPHPGSYSLWKDFAIEAGENVKLEFKVFDPCNTGNFNWWVGKLSVWSDWTPLSNHNYMTYRWVKTPQQILIDIRNNISEDDPNIKNEQAYPFQAKFTSNICEKPSYQVAWIATVWRGKTTRLIANAASSTGTTCANGFNLRYSNVKFVFDPHTTNIIGTVIKK